MWRKSYETTTREITAEQIWAVLSDVNHWHEWDDAISYARIAEPFKTGANIELKPKKGPKVHIEVLDCQPPNTFTDLARFPGALMTNRHDITYDPTGALVVKTTCTVSGPLGFLWRKLVAESIVHDFSDHTQKQIEAAKKR